MSAIWGIIDLSGKNIPEQDAKSMREMFSECALDRTEEILEENLYMGCGIQYFTEEAKDEVLPLSKHGLYMTADVVLDNRTELLNWLKDEEDLELDPKTPDGSILFQVYNRNIKESLDHMLGAYAFVQYNAVMNEVVMVGDAVGNRYVYYMLQGTILYFASLMKPVEKFQTNPVWNERWIAEFLGQDGLVMFTEGEETPKQGIYRIAPSREIIVSMDNDGQVEIQKRHYWIPKVQPGKIRYQNDQEYKQAFLKLYETCVADTLRSSGETAIFLSGGLDSASVAALAAMHLEKQGKDLYSFTSIPDSSIALEEDPGGIANESELVKEMQKMYPNIQCNFMDFPEMNAWFDRATYMKIHEFPYKSVQNVLWIYEGAKLAREKGARILLTGALGNGTVSSGDLFQYLVYLFQTGRFWKLFLQIEYIHKKRGVSRKLMLTDIIKRACTSSKKIALESNQNRLTFVMESFQNASGATKRLKIKQRRWEKGLNHYILYKNSLFEDVALRQTGESMQKDSLYTGVLQRDPTRDKRMIEFCIQIPLDQVNKEDAQRRLIRVYMKDMIPEIILTERRKGRQSVDMKGRFLKVEQEIVNEWLANYTKHLYKEKIDCEKAIEDLKEHPFQEMDPFDLIRHSYTNLMLEYLYDT